MRRCLASSLFAVALFGCGHPPPADPAIINIAAPLNGAQVSIGPFDVPQNTEVQLCRTLKLPNDQPLAVHSFEEHHNVGSHHVIIFRAIDPKLDVPDMVFPCWGTVNFDQWQFVADNQQKNGLGTWELPQGTGIVFQPHHQIMIQAHYVNANTVQTPTKGFSVTNLNAIPMNQLEHEAGGMFTVNAHLGPQGFIPPHTSNFTIERDCLFTQSVNLIAMTGHFHARGTRFDVSKLQLGTTSQGLGTVVGKLIYENTNWDNAPFSTFPDGPVPMIALAEGVHFTCTYDNESDNPVYWGGHADVQEHCNLFFWYYSIDPADPKPELNCTNGSGGGW